MSCDVIFMSWRHFYVSFLTPEKRQDSSGFFCSSRSFYVETCPGRAGSFSVVLWRHFSVIFMTPEKRQDSCGFLCSSRSFYVESCPGGKSHTMYTKENGNNIMGDSSIWAIYLYSHLSPIYLAYNVIQYIILDNFYEGCNIYPIKGRAYR